MEFQQFVALFAALSFASLFLLWQPTGVLSELKIVAEPMCDVGEFIIGLKQRYYWWEFEGYVGGVGIGNLSAFCSTPSAEDADFEGKKPSFVWNFAGNALLQPFPYPDAIIYNDTWEQMCDQPSEIASEIRLTKVSSLNQGTRVGAVTEHLILNCCSDTRQRENLVDKYELSFPVKQCSNATMLAGVCGLQIHYDDGFYSGNFWDTYWGVQNVTPICCEVGSGRIV